MFSLIIAEKPAVLAEKTQFKVTRENPAYEGSGEYSLDVTLPLEGCAENLAIFGPLHLVESSRAQEHLRSYPFRLTADNLSMQGVATVKSITEKEVKLTLAAGASLLNVERYDANGAEKYIDELDLGKAYDTIFRYFYPLSVYTQSMERTTAVMLCHDKALLDFMTKGLPFGVLNDGKGKYGGAECVGFPVYSVADGDMANRRAINYFSDGASAGQYFTWPMTKNGRSITHAPGDGTGFQSTVVTEGKECVIAPQPYLCVIVERVLAAAFGVTVDHRDNCMRWDERMARIFIANARGTMDYKNILPHWTVREFLREVSNFAGVTFDFDGDHVRIVPRVKMIEGGDRRITLKEVVEAYSCDIDTDGQTEDVSTANVGYAFENIPTALCFPTEIWKHAAVQTIGGYEYNDASAPEDVDEMTANTIFHHPESGLYYTWVKHVDGKWYLMKVNQVGPLFRRESRDVDVKLRIVPCQMGKVKYPVRYYELHDAPYEYRFSGERETGEVACLITDDSRLCDVQDFFDLWGFLRNETAAEKVAKRDVIEVAANFQLEMEHHLMDHGRVWQTHLYDSPLGIPYIMKDKGAPVQSVYSLFGRDDARPNELYDFWSLTAKENAFVTAQTQTKFAIDTRTEHIFTFLDEDAISPHALYYIGARYYVCKKIELTITPDGIAPVKTGYFYEIENAQKTL